MSIFRIHARAGTHPNYSSGSRRQSAAIAAQKKEGARCIRFQSRTRARTVAALPFGCSSGPALMLFVGADLRPLRPAHAAHRQRTRSRDRYPSDSRRRSAAIAAQAKRARDVFLPARLAPRLGGCCKTSAFQEVRALARAQVLHFLQGFLTPEVRLYGTLQKERFLWVAAFYPERSRRAAATSELCFSEGLQPLKCIV
jgi:hypothetical protein